MHVLGLVNVHETMTCEYFTNMTLVITLELDSGKHSKALVHNTLLEVVVGVQMLLSLPLWNHYGFTGDTVHYVSQESVCIMGVVMVELTSELELNVGNVDNVSVSNKVSRSPFLSEDAVEDATEWFILFLSILFVGISKEVSNKSLVVG